MEQHGQILKALYWKRQVIYKRMNTMWFNLDEILEQANLKVPIVTELFQKIEQEGFDMENDYPLTIEEAKDKFLEMFNKN